MLVLLLLAAVKLATGVVGFMAGAIGWTSSWDGVYPPWVNLVHLLAFTGAGGLLISGGRHDPRARALGIVFVLFGTSFSNRLIVWLASALPRGDLTLEVLVSVRPEAFLAAALWLFVRDFPQTSAFGSAARVSSLGLRLSRLVGAVLFFATVTTVWLPRITATPPPVWVQLLSDDETTGQFWTVAIPVILAALAFMFLKTPRARASEQRRVWLFALGLLIGSLPTLVLVFVELAVPSLGRQLAEPAARQLSGFIIHPLLLSIPVTTGYSVIVHRVLDVRFVVRKAIQYAFARYTLLGLLTVPAFFLLAYVYLFRQSTVAELLSGPRPLILSAIALLGALALSLRRPLLDRLDRRYFREQYDARRILAGLIERSRSATELETFAAGVAGEICDALHLDRAVLLIADTEQQELLPFDGTTRPLPRSAALVTLVSGDSSPLDIDLEDATSPLRRLPETERVWLADSGFQLLVPLTGSDGTLLGMLALGEKRSELAFSGEDRLLLTAVASSAALSVENRLMRSPSATGKESHRGTTDQPPSGRAAVDDRPAVVCRRCRRVHPPDTPTCPSCGGEVNQAVLPHVILGKFRLDSLLGAGGMGVVYRAVDTALNRPVAIKTLPRFSPEVTMRLRREARAMAMVQHPNLALIFGAESWHGRPVLIVELLAGGTLKDRLHRGPLSPGEALHLGAALASATEKIHAAGILHRDIKPSNIGYSSEGVPKLLDFGLARMVQPGPVADPSDTTISVTEFEQAASVAPGDWASSGSHHLVGTVQYLAPEAIRLEPPSPALDLWSLGVVLYQALTGHNPFTGGTVEETISRITKGVPSDAAQFATDCPRALSKFVVSTLDLNPKARPAAAREFRLRVEHLRSELGFALS